MQIQSLLTKKGSLNQYQLKVPNDESIKEIEYIKEKTSFYITKENDDFVKDFKIRYYIFKNNLQESDITCSHQECNNQTSYNRTKTQFNQVCCNACKRGNINIANKKKENYNNKTQEEKNNTIRKRITTNQEKYGGNAPLCSKEIQEKQQQTNLKKYGTEYTTHIARESFERVHGVNNPSQLEDHQTKVKETNQKNLGVDYPAQSKEIQEKQKRTNIAKWGCEFPQQHPTIKEKTRNTNIQKYGVENPSQLTEIQEKIKLQNIETYGVDHPMKLDSFKKNLLTIVNKTNMKKYGVDFPMQSKGIQDKGKQTRLEKYGSISAFGNKEIQDKIKELFINVYGVDNPFKSEKIQEEIKNQNIENYGVPYLLNSNEIQEKIKNTNIQRYGVDYLLKSKEIQEKIKQNRIEKYGVPYPAQKNIENFELFYDKEFIEKTFIDNTNKKFLLNDFMKFFNCENVVGYIRLAELGIDYVKYGCTSRGEKEVYEFVKQITEHDSSIEVIENDRTFGKEFDILIKKDNKEILSIEYNGLYWHSYDKGKKYDKSYYRNKHIEKTELAESNNFPLLHIFENEWTNNQDIWKSVIMNSLGVSSTRIHTRKCTIKEVQSNDSKEFLINNHLQGNNIRGSIRLGLYYEDELVSLMTFGKTQFKKVIEERHYEIIRFCNKINTNIPGAASKLLKYFERKYNPTLVVSYANRRWSQGNLYNKLGFKRTSMSPPNHYYIENGKLYHRVKFQAHKVKKLLGENYDSTLSGFDNGIFNLNLGVIWDSGNYVFEKEY